MAPSLKDKYQKTAARERGITADQIEAFSLKLERFLNKHVGGIIDDLDIGLDSAISSARALIGIEDSLIELGLDDLVDDLAEIYGDKLNYIRAKFEALAGAQVVFNTVDIESITQLIKFDIESIKLKTFATVADLRSAVMRSVVTGENPRQLWRDSFGNFQTSVNTEQATALAGFEQSITKAKADELGIELFWYIGPDDEKTREFCQSRVDRVFHMDEIDEWDNGQDLPVWTYRGGYNCRHNLEPISVEEAKNKELSPGARDYINDQTN